MVVDFRFRGMTRGGSLFSSAAPRIDVAGAKAAETGVASCLELETGDGFCLALPRAE